MTDYKIIVGDCAESLHELADASVDSIVTDPPYGLGFMGKKWDVGTPAVDVFIQCLRVLKPGGHLLAFGGSRTYHRLAVATEDAGFEIRDQIMWLYGSGFPKSMNVANAIHDAATGQPQGGRKPSSKNHGKYKGGSTEGNPSGRGFGAGPGQFMADAGTKSERELVEAARMWDGWGTALKPAHEPIVVARKPLEGTVAANVQAHGTGAINVDGCRIEGIKGVPASPRRNANGGNAGGIYGRYESPPADTAGWDAYAGRWPANVIHDGSDEVLAGFPNQKSPATYKRRAGTINKIYGGGLGHSEPGDFASGYGDAGSASRFFYCAKASKRDRGEGNDHPTVKPTDLMRYLCRLVTPPGGTVLDPFMGSGSTGKAAMLEGFKFIGIEQDAEYAAIAESRIQCEEGNP